MTLPARGSKEDVGLRESLGLSGKAEDAIFTATWLGKLILFGIGQGGATRCPGLSAEDCRFLQLYGKKETWTPNAVGGLNLVETKVVSAKFLASGAFFDIERFLPALFASADPNSRLSDIGDDILKRATSAVSFEDPILVQQLYEIYLGTRGAEGSFPARVPLQTKILALLCKSKLASSFIQESKQIVQEGLAVPKGAQDLSISQPNQGLEASKLRYVISGQTPFSQGVDLQVRYVLEARKRASLTSGPDEFLPQLNTVCLRVLGFLVILPRLVKLYVYLLLNSLFLILCLPDLSWELT